MVKDTIIGRAGKNMTKLGLKVAIAHAQQLPIFTSLEDAQQSLFDMRDKIYRVICSIEKQHCLGLDFSPESLKTIEKLYFELLKLDTFDAVGLSQESLEFVLGYYMAFTCVQNNREFKWVVEESPFSAGKYEIGIQKHLFTMMVGPIKHLPKVRNNKLRESRFRDYKQYGRPL